MIAFVKRHWMLLAVFVAVVYVENHGKQFSNLIAKAPGIGKALTGRTA